MSVMFNINCSEDIPIYYVKAENIFLLFEETKDFDDTKSLNETVFWLNSLKEKQINQRKIISASYDHLMISHRENSRTESPPDPFVSTIVKIWTKRYVSCSYDLCGKEWAKFKNLPVHKTKERFVALKRFCFFQHLVIKEYKALVDDLKKVVKIRTTKPQSISKLSDLSRYLKQFELSKEEANELNIPVNVREISHEYYSLLQSVLQTYGFQLLKLRSKYDSVLGILRSLPLVSSRAKVRDDFIRFKDDVYSEIVQYVADTRSVVADASLEEKVMLLQKSANKHRSLCGRFVEFYKTFSQFD